MLVVPGCISIIHHVSKHMSIMELEFIANKFHSEYVSYIQNLALTMFPVLKPQDYVLQYVGAYKKLTKHSWRSDPLIIAYHAVFIDSS